MSTPPPPLPAVYSGVAYGFNGEPLRGGSIRATLQLEGGDYISDSVPVAHDGVFGALKVAPLEGLVEGRSYMTHFYYSNEGYPTVESIEIREHIPGAAPVFDLELNFPSVVVKPPGDSGDKIEVIRAELENIHARIGELLKRMGN